MRAKDRDRLVALRKAKKRLLTQRQAAEELGLSVRQVKRLVRSLKKHGDKAVIHGLRGRPPTSGLRSLSNKKRRRSCQRICIKASGRRWPLNTWPISTISKSARKPYGNG